MAVAAGDKVTLWWPSANRDEEVFDDPSAFDVRRSPNPHLGFGAAGPHFCLGAHLARQEIGVMLGLLLTRRTENSTVTLCHTGTRDLPSLTRQADIIVAAVGRRNTLTADMVKPGAIVIDVGTNRNDQGKLCGDVDFAAVKEIAGWITPVPGGVGPMTVTMLLVNTVQAAEAGLR